MIIEFLSVFTFISALIAIVFRLKKNVKLFSVFKPLTTILIISIAVMTYMANPSNYSLIIILGLLASLIGDIFLISEKYFLQGLSSFLIAHIAFTYAFTLLFGFNFNIIALVALVIIGGSYYMFLFKKLDDFKIPVAVYILVIMIMNWQAVGLMLNDASSVYIMLAVGSLLFSFSDAVISYDKFIGKFKIAEILILSTYWLAIYIFAVTAGSIQ
ncbi:MAG: lysoplasmalogenase [Bacteroidetes bacterium 4572_112]|nr:MAG: lysoplasmalogenase [Bacteroidetes bacterium 4572_112]